MSRTMHRIRRAISPVIAVVLIIALTVAAIATVWLLFNNFGDVSEDLKIEVTVYGFYDFDGDGRAEMMTIKVKSQLTASTVDISSATFSLSNSSGDLSSWEKMGNSDTNLIPLQDGYVNLRTKDSGQELTLNRRYVLTVEYGVKKDIDFTVESITDVPPLTIELGGSGGALSVDIAAAIGDSPEEISKLGSTTVLSSVRVVIINAETGFPVAGMDKVTNSKGRVSFRLAPGYYSAKVFLGSNSKTFGPFYHPSDITDVSKVRRIDISNTFQTVTVYYRENGIPISNAKVVVHEKLVYGNKVYERALSTSKYTDTNGSVTFVLRKGEYRFLVYHASPTPAPSDWINIANQDVVTIDVSPGTVYVKVVSGSNNPVSNARVRAYAVVGTSTSYLGYSYTNSSGYTSFTITSTEFKVQVTQGAVYTSNVFKVVNGKTYEFVLSGNDLTVNMKTSSGSPVSNSYIYLYNSYGKYISSEYSNSSGQAVFTGLANGSYYLRYYAGGNYVKTSVFSVMSAYTYNITLTGINFYANITSSNGTPRQNQYVYAYLSDNTYLGWARTNSSGIASFFVNSNQSAYIRVSAYLSGTGYTYFKSSVFTPTDGLVVPLVIGGKKITVTVTDQNGTALSTTYITAYDSTGKPVQSSYTNSTGHAVLALADNSLYRVGVDNIRSNQFNTSTTTTVSLVLNVSTFTIHAKNVDGTDLSGAYVYLYVNTTNGWRYLGRQTTPTNGQVTFSEVEGAVYRVYVYQFSAGIRFYSSNFTISQGKVITVQPASMTVYVHFNDGTVLANQYIYIYDEQKNYMGYARTDTNGNATIMIVNGLKYMVYLPTSRYYSSVFTGVNGGVLDLLITLPKVSVQVKDPLGQNYAPTSTWEAVYVYYSNGSYAGYSYLNSSGAATFFLSNATEYYFRFYRNGHESLSSNFNATDGLVVPLQITGYVLTVTVNMDGSPLASTYLYLYDASTRQYTGYARTNSTGQAVFAGILNGTYYTYASSSAVRQTSAEFTVAGDSSYVFNITTTTLTVSVHQVDSTGKVGANQRIYLRTLDGYYAGYKLTNSTGDAVFTVAVNSSYYAYTYYSSIPAYIYSDFVAVNTTTVLHVRPVSMSVTVFDGNNNRVSNMRVFLQKEGVSLGYAITNSSGIATVYGNNGTEYFFVAAKYTLSYGYTYSNLTKITARQGLTSSINIGGGDLTITVKDFSGDPASGVYVYLYKPVGSSYQWTGYYGKTDASGQLVLTGVGSGTYVAYVYGVFSSPFTMTTGNYALTINM